MRHDILRDFLSAGCAPLVVSDVHVEQTAYHLLILSMILFGLHLEEVYRIFAQADRDFDLFFIEGKLRRRWQEIINHFNIAQGFIRVFYSFLHRFSFPFANSPPQ